MMQGQLGNDSIRLVVLASAVRQALDAYAAAVAAAERNPEDFEAAANIHDAMSVLNAVFEAISQEKVAEIEAGGNMIQKKASGRGALGFQAAVGKAA